MRRYVLVYDSDCGSCTRFRRIVGFLDTRGRLDFLPLTDADREGVLDSIPRGRRHRSFHLVSPAGRVSSGAAAVPELIRLLPAGRVISKLLKSAPLGFWSVAFVYSVFSRLHDSGSCNYTKGGPSDKERVPPKASHSIRLGILYDQITAQ